MWGVRVVWGVWAVWAVQVEEEEVGQGRLPLQGMRGTMMGWGVIPARAVRWTALWVPSSGRGRGAPGWRSEVH